MSLISGIRKAINKGWGKLARKGLACKRCPCPKFRHSQPWGGAKYMTCKCGHECGSHEL